MPKAVNNQPILVESLLFFSFLDQGSKCNGTYCQPSELRQKIPFQRRQGGCLRTGNQVDRKCAKRFLQNEPKVFYIVYTVCNYYIFYTIILSKLHDFLPKTEEQTKNKSDGQGQDTFLFPRTLHLTSSTGPFGLREGRQEGPIFTWF